MTQVSHSFFGREMLPAARPMKFLEAKYFCGGFKNGTQPFEPMVK
jgi:hypothetical protein